MEDLLLKRKKNIIILFLFILVVITSCGKSTKAKKLNALDGTGEVKNLNYVTGYGGVYDNDNVYLVAMICPTTMNYSYIKVTKDNKAYVNCDIASCNHTTSNCQASATYQYFEFNGKLYRYGHSVTKVADTDKVVFKNSIPKSVKDVDADTLIDGIFVMDKKYAVVRATRYGYLVDNNFNILYTFTDEGNSNWGKVYDNKF